MNIANINRFIQYLQAAFDGLGAEVGLDQIEQIAMVVHSAMESPRRHYHCSDHALYMCEGMAPREVLAAVFHDIVYYQLDDGFPARVTHLLTPLVGRQGNDLLLRKTAGDDPDMQLCLELFGFEPGQSLPLFRGMNEFLSAAVAVRMLQPYLAPVDLIAVIACIEATIPFRAPEPDGRDNIQMLADRVRAQGIKRLGIAQGPALDAFVDATMASAVRITNRDVAGFAEPNSGRFVSSTWLLIEESNAPLAAVGVYTLQDYREALSRMLSFLENLQAERVFHHYGGHPTDAEYAALTAAAAANIAFTVTFLRLKILTITVVEAMARDTGGNCPVSMFLGDMRSNFGMPERVEDYLPAGPSPAGLDAQLLHMLEKGRPDDLSNDLAMSPLTAYVYRCLGVQGCDDALTSSRRMLKGEISPREFLLTLPPIMLQTVIDACARIAISRKDKLKQLRSALVTH